MVIQIHVAPSDFKHFRNESAISNTPGLSSSPGQAPTHVSYETFRKVLSRARKKARASAAPIGKSPELPSVGSLGEADAAPRDPLANLKRLEQNRPGFHWRANPSVKDSDMSWAEWREKNKRQ